MHYKGHRSAFGNLSGSEADHADSFKNAAQSLLRAIQRLYGRKPELTEVAYVGSRYGFMSAQYSALTDKTPYKAIYEAARSEYDDFYRKLEKN